MSKKKSRAWVRQHISDPFVKKSKSDRLRSRSSYKLAELIDRLGLLERGMAVVDLGAAPGGGLRSRLGLSGLRVMCWRQTLLTSIGLTG